MSKGQETPFIYFEAKPKRGNSAIVNQKIMELMSFFAEIFDKNRRNCTFRPERKGNMWTVLITFESEEAKSLLEQDSRFQEAITDLRVYCKPAHRLRRFIFAILHPGKRLAGFLSTPIRLM